MRRAVWTVTAASVLLAGSPRVGEAQGSCTEVLGRIPCPVDVGSRLRVVDRQGTLRVGTALSVGGSEIALRTEQGSTVTRPWNDISTLERSLGRKGHGLTGALVGAGVAAVVLGVALATEDCGSDYCSGGVDPGPGLIFGGSMTAAGFVVGFLIRTEGWEPLLGR